MMPHAHRCLHTGVLLLWCTTVAANAFSINTVDLNASETRDSNGTTTSYDNMRAATADVTNVLGANNTSQTTTHANTNDNIITTTNNIISTDYNVIGTGRSYDLENVTLDEVKVGGSKTNNNNSDIQYETTEVPANEHVMKIQTAKKVNGTNEWATTALPTKSPTGLYAVKPTYKRPKKLEISTPVTFTRDPNDNSWRNESINSLGIVFKANNTSKPFTLIAKEKSESELIATMQKFDNEQEDSPELKERLSKLSEQRKMKKKPSAEEERATTTARSKPKQPHIEPMGDYEPILAIQNEFKQSSKHHIATTTLKHPLPDLDATAAPANGEDSFDDYGTKQLANMQLNKVTTVVTPPLAHNRKPTLQYFPPRKPTPTPPPPTPPQQHTPTANRHVLGHATPQQQYYQFAHNVPKSAPQDFGRNVLFAQQVPYVQANEYAAATPHDAYPVLYNNSVVHDGGGGGGGALSSSAFMKRLYEQRADCDDCYNEDLAPEYELHYYVPDQEETQLYERLPAAVGAHGQQLPFRMYVRHAQ